MALALALSTPQCDESNVKALSFLFGSMVAVLIGLWLLWKYVLSNKSLVVRYVATLIMLFNHVQVRGASSYRRLGVWKRCTASAKVPHGVRPRPAPSGLLSLLRAVELLHPSR